MFENIKNIFKRSKKRELLKSSSKDTAKERLHLVLMQDRANVSADFLDLMRQEIIEVIKKYIDIDEEAMDVRLATETNEDGTQGAPALYANIPIINIKDETVNEEKMPETENKKNDENNEAYTEEKTEEVIQESKEETKENKDENENKEEKPEKSTEKVKQNETVKKETTEKKDKKEIKEEKKENEE